MANELEQIQALLAEFRRPCPEDEEYQERLAEEFGIIINQRFTEYFLKIRRVLDLNKDIPHMTRTIDNENKNQLWLENLISSPAHVSGQAVEFPVEKVLF
jgi:hypothetical protein